MKREQIISAALRLLAEKGLHEITFADIAKEAQVGIGTIYKYFSSKEDIIQKVWIEQKKWESSFIFKDYDATGTIRDRFDFLWGRVIRYFAAERTCFYFSYHYAASPILTREVHEIAMKDFLQFDALFQQGLKKKIFKPLRARQLRLYTFSTINGWLLWAMDEKVKFTPKTIDLFLQMAWDAVALPGKN